MLFGQSDRSHIKFDPVEKKEKRARESERGKEREKHKGNDRQTDVETC